MTERSGRRRVVGALSGALCAGFVLSASAVDARPIVMLDQVDLGGPVATIAPGDQALGSRATVSGDGRFVAYEGRPGAGDPAVAAIDTRTSTVYLTDRETATTTEVTVVPAGLRPGNSIHPVLSGDGCSIVVVTELALDVFRDDDTGLRWDVYRQRLEPCGGTPGDWELVSSHADGSAIARDDVDIDDPPAVSRAGNAIAFTHPASQLLDGDGITTVSLVDLGQPIGSPDRSRPVAGMPIVSPDTQYVHAGIDQPAISGDGRFVAYRSDAASTDAVPGWGYGAVEGGPATPQVFVWDRAQADPFEAVKLVSKRVDGLPTMTGAAEPGLSRDGRAVAFTSSDVGLVPAVFPPCGDGCPAQVYHLDRDIDVNGRYDEADRTEMTLVSSEPETSPVVAGTAPSSQPSISADGHLVAFVTKATNLQVVKAAGGGAAGDGDLLIADVARNTLRRVTMIDGGVRPAVGAHSGPQLSDTGRTVVFDSLAAAQLVPGSPAGRQVVTTVSPPTLSLAEGDLGTTLVGFTSDEWYVAVNNDGPTTFTPSSVSVSDGRFRVNQEQSTCALGVPVPPGGDCTVRLTFTPSAPGPVTAKLTVAESGFQAVSVSTTVRGSGGDPMLRTTPAGQALGSVVVGQSGSEFLFDVENISFLPTSVASVRVVGPHPFDFVISSNSCERRSLNPRSTCSIGVTFAPTAAGQRSAVIEVATPTGQYTVMVPDGLGRYEPNFVLDRAEVDAGREFGIGGNGFPPSTPVAILFGDDPSSRVDIVTNAEGAFLMSIPTRSSERGGNRTVVAQAADGTTASAPLLVVEQPTAMTGMPGFGLGG
ncbi:MAG TPA: choice-of-anchor D domain-containing protein [Ilumatobacteraceae bacterium]|nr:choice-of-anchor D domain-containing protein [Ilumatobacteraceae bacterium]